MDQRQLIDRAITNLSQFSLVGNLSQPKQFAVGLGRITGKILPQWRRNQAPKQTFVPPDLVDRISTLCAADLEIYNAMQRKPLAA
jgi:hypothetical protein